MGLGPAGTQDALLAPPGATPQGRERDGRAEAAGSPTAHLDSAAVGFAAVVPPGTPSSPAAVSNGGEHVQPGPFSASEGSELGKESSADGSVFESSTGSTSGSGSGGLAPHYDANQDVILRLEFLRAKEVKVRPFGQWA